MREGSRLDRAISLASIVTTSVPEFASGVFLQSIFVIWLGLLPGTSPLDPSGGWSIASQLVLPVAVMVLYDLGYVVRMVRASMVEIMTRPYIRTAVLKGLSFREVILKHAIRNAMIAPFTVILLQINYLVTGVVVVEAVFGYPGLRPDDAGCRPQQGYRRDRGGLDVRGLRRRGSPRSSAISAICCSTRASASPERSRTRAMAVITAPARAGRRPAAG